MKRRPKGTGTITETAEGKFRARFAFTPGKREDIDGSPFATYDEADRALDAVLVVLRDGDITKRGVLLKKLAEGCLDQREKAGYRDVKNDRNRSKCYIESWDLANAPASTITRGDVRAWLASLKVSTSTKKNALNLLRAVFAYGVDAEKIDENPCNGIKVKDNGTTLDTSTFLTKEEADALIAAATDPAVALAIGTGMRSGELRALRWEDVGDTHITVRYGKPNSPTKGGRVRKVPILPVAARALAELRKDRPDGDARGVAVLRAVRSTFRAKGQVVEREAWRAWLAACGVGRRVRFHDLRHTTATLLLTGAWGEPWTLEEVKEMLGHSSVKVTERYARATGSLADRAARHKVGTGSAGETPEQAQAREMLGRRGSDSNRRMTVLQGGGERKRPATLHGLATLARSYAELVARNDPRMVSAGLDLAEAAWSIAELSEVANG